jgi:hypothetical protein
MQMTEGVTQQFMNYYRNMVKYLNLKDFVSSIAVPDAILTPS